ncbi:MAG: BrnT family toxin [Synergistaceae bacterium]|nr:BrnT family toxin [Synergistaceae bacterium]
MSDEIKFQLGELSFTWDDRKAESNIEKHAVSFDMAAEVFFDEYAIEEPDTTTDEERYRIIGKAMFFASPVLFVVFAERYNIRGEQLIRIISARRAKGKEIKKYERA